MDWVHDLSVFFRVVLYIMGSVAALAACVAAIVKLWKWMRKPHEETNAALEKYKLEAADEHKRLSKAIEANQKAIENIYTILGRDKERMDKYDANFRVLYRGMLALLDQQINPNGNLEQMQKARDELNAHIIDN